MVLYCLAWTITRAVVRYPLILLINFVTIYTGFGLFLGVLTPILLILDHRSSSVEGRLPKAYLAVALLIALDSLSSFFIGYRFNADLACFSFQPQSPTSYLAYVAVMCANFWAVKGTHGPSLLIGLATLVAFLACVATAAWRLVRHDGQNLPVAEKLKSLIPMTLVAYTLLFCANTAYGRLCGGLWSAQSSRYVIYVELAVLGLYFQLISGHQIPRQKLVLAGLVAVIITASFAVDRSTIAYYRYVKVEWKACYIRTEDISGCNQFVGSPIFSHAPERARLQEKLQFLKKTRQNLYLAPDKTQVGLSIQ
jgi:hypothetical protein